MSSWCTRYIRFSDAKCIKNNDENHVQYYCRQSVDHAWGTHYMSRSPSVFSIVKTKFVEIKRTGGSVYRTGTAVVQSVQLFFISRDTRRYSTDQKWSDAPRAVGFARAGSRSTRDRR